MKFAKRFLATILALMMIVSVAPMAAFAETVSEVMDGFEQNAAVDVSAGVEEALSIREGDAITVTRGVSFKLNADLASGNYPEAYLQWTCDTDGLVLLSYANGDTCTVVVNKVGVHTVTVSSATLDLSDSIVITATECGVIALDQTIYGTMHHVDGENPAYAFTAPKTGIYGMYLESNEYYIQGSYLRDDGRSQKNYGYGVQMQVELQEGQVCYFRASHSGNYVPENSSYPYALTVKEMVPAEEIFFLESSFSEVYMDYGEKIYWVAFSPDNAIAENITWSVSDPDVLTLGDGYMGSNGTHGKEVILNQPGTCVLTAQTQSGLKAEFSITVLNTPQLSLEKPSFVSGGELRFEFSPEESGKYIFTSYDSVNADPRAALYAEEGHQLAYNDDYDPYRNFRIVYDLVAGEKYYLTCMSWNWNSDSGYYVKVEKAEAATEAFFEETEMNVTEGQQVTLKLNASPEGAYLSLKETDIVFSDPTVAKVNYVEATMDGGYWVYFTILKAGETTASVTLPNETVASVTFVAEGASEAVLNQTYTVNTTTNSDGNSYKFTAPETGTYKISVDSPDNDLVMIWNTPNSGSANDGYQFCDFIYLNQGETAILFFDPFEQEETRAMTYSFVIETTAKANGIYFVNGENYEVYEENGVEIVVGFAPSNAVPEDLEWCLDGDGVVEYCWDRVNALHQKRYYLRGVAAGTATLTISMENGQSITANITVKEPDSIQADTTVSVTGYTLYRFVPEESGYYRLYSNGGDIDPFVGILDAQKNEVDYCDNSNGTPFFDFAYFFEKGQTYYLSLGANNWNREPSFTFHFEKVPSVTSFSITTEETYIGYVGTKGYLDLIGVPEGAQVLVGDIIIEDPDVAVISHTYPMENGSEGVVVVFQNVGETVMTVIDRDGNTDTILLVVKEANELNVGESKTFTVNAGEELVPIILGMEGEDLYQVSVSSDCNVEAELICGERTYSFEDSELRFQPRFFFGENRILWVKIAEKEEVSQATYTVKLEKAVPATSMTFVEGETMEVMVGDDKVIYVEFGPENGGVEEVYWTVSDPEIAEIAFDAVNPQLQYGVRVMFKKAGTVTITATSQSGFTDTMTVTVNPIPTIEAGETVSGTVIPKELKKWAFSPESGEYLFSFEGSSYLPDAYRIVIWDTEGNTHHSFYGNDFEYRFFVNPGVTWYISVEGDGDFNFSFTKKKAVTGIEILTYPDMMNYVEGTFASSVNFHGLSARVTWEDGTSADWFYGYDNTVEDLQMQVGWNSNDGTVFLTCGAKTVSFTVNFIPNPVSYIEVLPMEEAPYVIENYSGYWESYYDYEAEEYKEYFYYYSPYNLDQVAVRIVYNDGTEAFANVFDTVEGYDVSWNYNQRDDHWVRGGKNEIKITYLGKEASFSVEVRENPVLALEILSGETPVYIENAYGEILTRVDPATGEEVPYFAYNWEAPDNYKVKIIYRDGTERIVENATGAYVDGEYFNWENDQYIHPWKMGEDNSLILSYMGVQVRVPVSLIENPVVKVELDQAPTREYIYGDCKYGVMFSDENYYFFPTDLTGIVFTVYMKDGTEKTYTYEDLDMEEYLCDGFGFDLRIDDTDCAPDQREFSATFYYMGFELDYNVSVKESPLQSIEILENPHKTEYINESRPILDGLKVKLLFEDGSEKIVTFENGNYTIDFDWNFHDYVYVLEADGIVINVRPDMDNYRYYNVSCLGQTERIEAISIEEEYVQAQSMENISFQFPEAEGQVLLKYKNGNDVLVTFSEETVTWFRSLEEYSMAWGMVLTEEGYLSFECYRDEAGNYSLYMNGAYLEFYADDNEDEEDGTDGVIGDLNGNDEVNTEDVVYLLYHTLFGEERYPVAGVKCDFDANGEITSEDAVYLLYHLLFGEERYPLA